MTLSESTGTKVIGRYLPDASQVAINQDYYDIISESDDYIALFKPGRSIYISGRGSEYEPARIFFCEIIDMGVDSTDNRGERLISLVIHLDTPIRRR